MTIIIGTIFIIILFIILNKNLEKLPYSVRRIMIIVNDLLLMIFTLAKKIINDKVDPSTANRMKNECNEQLTKRYNKSEDENKKLKQKYNKLEDENKKLEDEYKKLKQKYIKLEDENKKLEDENKKLKQKCKNLEDNNKKNNDKPKNNSNIKATNTNKSTVNSNINNNPSSTSNSGTNNISTSKKDIIIYASRCGSNNCFLQTSTSITEDSVYELTVRNNKAEFVLLPMAVKKVISTPEYLTIATDFTLGKTERYDTHQKGIAEFQNNKWIVIQKLKIKFI